ncbi:magnesium/cobalt transporter CorA [bacterium]|jgi:magnesium transporter|nr:magnesium/cobalt transporter CorA [bacterium]
MISAYIYADGKVEVIDSVERLSKDILQKGKVWLDISQPADGELKKVLEEFFNFHPLSIEDCFTEMHYPKVDDYGNYLFIVIHAPDFTHLETFETVEVDVFLGKDFLVTYSRAHVKSTDTLKEKCIKDSRRTFEQGMDMMFYNLVDSTMDNYNNILDFFEKRIQKFEDEVVDGEITISLKDIILLRNDLKEVRRIQQPQRELFNRLSKQKFSQILDKTRRYMRDTYDAMYRINDEIDNLRDYINSVRDIYMTVESNKMNRVMKTLTVIATIMMPFVVIASIYGMNISLPLGDSPHSFMLIMVIMFFVTVVFMFWFKKKKWL